ncbi:MAG TPA: HNH endonuclease signature motif containing protein [Anaeromyxobacteraceae bacterium]|nr:HNH endonuclease signature motif containing protein [Anaeromyxobacteraceae bacterium]
MNDTRDLTNRLAQLLRREHGALADFLVALADFDRERRWVELGHTSLFYFLHRELGLSKGAAFYRKTAAELIQRYPEVVEPLREGKLCMTSVVELAKVITPENRGEVVARFFHASKREAKAVAAELRPAEAAPHRDVVTALPLAAPVKAVTRLEMATSLAMPSAVVQPDELRGEAPASPSRPPPPAPLSAARPDEVEPLTGDLRRYHFTVSKRFLAKLAAARDALSHSHPGADTEAVLEAALDLLLAANDKKKGLVKKPRPSPARPSANPRHIPAEVKRAVWTRDGGCCRWPLASGGVCGSTTRLELDHIVPIARGGTSTVSNLRVLCDFHNQHAARQVFGEAWMDQFTSRSRSASREEGAPGSPGSP